MTVTILACAVAAAFVTGAVRRYALHRDLLDHPNARSSHVTPTPRGGGLSIVLVSIAAFVALGWAGLLSPPAAIGLVGTGILIASIGFVDDHGHVAPGVRFATHFVAATWAWHWLGHDMTWWFSGIVIVGLVWATNFYNFMDGIDGIAGIEAVTVCGAAAVMMAMTGVDTGWILATAAVGAASAGFLVWNFPPARIFMGDVGSGFLGVTLGALALGSGTYWSWLILIGVFVVDATFTLFRRLARGERLHHAHRSHAYQHAALRFGHRPVTLATAAINVLWLAPWAIAVAHGAVGVATGVIVAFAPLVIAVAYFRAGK